MSVSVVTATPIAGVPEGAPVDPAVDAGSTGRHLGRPHTTTVHHRTTRSSTMFQALYADLARAHRTRRQREYQRRLEAQTQHDMLLAMPRMLAR
ncbi:hypothetical protein GCM10025782_16850 [Pedococcus ginsenosidimutans]|uniref:Uncharacterized protein n=1 Tax=Pedococcus ginsenosidimutans TaxID=490570 RepID=A0ABP8Y4I7_9MICO